MISFSRVVGVIGMFLLILRMNHSVVAYRQYSTDSNDYIKLLQATWESD